MTVLTREAILETIRQFQVAAAEEVGAIANAAALKPKARPDASFNDEGEPDEIDYTRFTSPQHLLSYVYGDTECEDGDIMRLDQELEYYNNWARFNKPSPAIYPLTDAEQQILDPQKIMIGKSALLRLLTPVNACYAC